MAAEFTIGIAAMEDEAVVSALVSASYTTLLPAAYAPSVLAAMLPKITRASPYLLSSGAGVGKLIYSRCEIMARLAGVIRFESFSSLNALRVLFSPWVFLREEN